MRFAALFLFLVGCSEGDLNEHFPRQAYELQDGTQVSCRWEEREACGLRLTDCTDGQTYRCETNVRKVSE